MEKVSNLKGIDIKAIADIEKLEKVSFILKTIAHPLRIGIISLLVENDHIEEVVGKIKNKAPARKKKAAKKLGSEQSLTSHHLSNMRLAGILGSIRNGKNIYYFLKLREVVEVIQCMNQCDIL